MIILTEKRVSSLKEDTRMKSDVFDLLDSHLAMLKSGKSSYKAGSPANNAAEILSSMLSAMKEWVWQHRDKNKMGELGNFDPEETNSISTRLYGMESKLKSLAQELNY
jgi:hypothetical protein